VQTRPLFFLFFSFFLLTQNLGQQTWACLALEARQPLRCGAPSGARGQSAPRLGVGGVAPPQTTSVLGRRAGRYCFLFFFKFRSDLAIFWTNRICVFTETIGTNGDTIVCFFGRENSYTLWTLIRSGSALLFLLFVSYSDLIRRKQSEKVRNNRKLLTNTADGKKRWKNLRTKILRPATKTNTSMQPRLWQKLRTLIFCMAFSG
jgi:hypothetical protein